jgi:hypothetical protein
VLLASDMGKQKMDRGWIVPDHKRILDARVSSWKVARMNNEVVFAVETTLMSIVILLQIAILVVMVYFLNKMATGDKTDHRKCP